MISSGRFSTFSVAGAYWISCISSFWNTTLPGETAMFSPMRNASVSVILMRSWPLPRSRSVSRLFRPLIRFSPPVSAVLAQHFGIGQQEIGRAHRVDELARIEIDLLGGRRIEPVHLLHHVLHEAGGQQVGLPDEVENLVFLPGVVPEALVLGVGIDHRLAVQPPSCAARCSARATCSPARSRAAPASAWPGWPSAARSFP